MNRSYSWEFMYSTPICWAASLIWGWALRMFSLLEAPGAYYGEKQVVEQLGRMRFSSDRLNLSICYSGLQWRNTRFHLHRSETTLVWDPMAGMQCVNKSVIEAGEKVRDTAWRSDLNLKTTRCVRFFSHKTQHNHVHALLRHNGGNVQPQCPLLLPHSLPLKGAPGRWMSVVIIGRTSRIS